MKFGINTFLFASPFTTERLEFLREFKDMGFDAVEIAFENEGDLDYRVTLQALKDNGLACCSLCGAFGKGRDLRGSEEERRGRTKPLQERLDVVPMLLGGTGARPALVSQELGVFLDDGQVPWQVRFRVSLRDDTPLP